MEISHTAISLTPDPTTTFVYTAHSLEEIGEVNLVSPPFTYDSGTKVLKIQTNEESYKGQYVVRFKATCQNSAEPLLDAKTVLIDLTVDAFDYTF